jgi:hypothetical protein
MNGLHKSSELHMHMSKKQVWPIGQVNLAGKSTRPGTFGLPGKPAGEVCRASLPGKSAGQVCRASLPGKSAGQVCRASLPGKSAGQVCRARLPAGQDKSQLVLELKAQQQEHQSKM